MRSSRRDFLKRGTLVALGAGVPLALAEQTLGRTTATSKAAELDMASFKSQLGSSFLVYYQAAKVPLTLVDVANFASQKETAAGKEGFTLRFRGPKETALKQDTYLFEHDKLGMFSFLIVPVSSRDQRATHYDAIINRLTP